MLFPACREQRKQRKRHKKPPPQTKVRFLRRTYTPLPVSCARRRKVRLTPFPPRGENCVRSLAPPFPTQPAPLGLRGDPRLGLLRPCGRDGEVLSPNPMCASKNETSAMRLLRFRWPISPASDCGERRKTVLQFFTVPFKSSSGVWAVRLLPLLPIGAARS